MLQNQKITAYLQRSNEMKKKDEKLNLLKTIKNKHYSFLWGEKRSLPLFKGITGNNLSWIENLKNIEILSVILQIEYELPLLIFQNKGYSLFYAFLFRPACCSHCTMQSSILGLVVLKSAPVEETNKAKT